MYYIHLGIILLVISFAVICGIRYDNVVKRIEIIEQTLTSAEITGDNK